MFRSTATAIALVAPLFAASGANATDLSDPMIEERIAKERGPVDIWTGFYGGVGVSGGMTGFDSSAADTGGEIGFIDGISSEGFGLTGVVGYDRLFARKWVLGVGIDGSYSPDGWYEGDMSAIGVGDADISGGFAKEYDWTAFARFGWIPTQATLVYALAGYTQAHFDLPSVTVPGENGGDPVTTSFGDQAFDGWTVGLGFETKLDKAWSLDVQGRYTRFEDETIYSSPDDGDTLTINTEPEKWQVLFTLRGKLLTNY